jgi:predicted outer membrane repeat protein
MATALIQGNTFTRCEAMGGGAIKIAGGQATITGNTFEDNNALAWGAGVFIGGGTTAVLTDNTMTDNNAVMGGALDVDFTGQVTVIGGLFEGNKATGPGGAIYSYGGELTLERAVVRNNQAEQAGAVYISDGSLTLTNCALLENASASMAGAVEVERTTLAVYATTFRDNTSTDGGAIYAEDGEPVVQGCILWGNTPNQITMVTGAATVTFSDVQGGWPDMTNLNVNPAFAAGSDYHISETSPCREVSTDCGTAVDIDGQPRPYGGGYDMGGDEWQPAILTPTVTVSATATPSVSATATISPMTATPTDTVTPTLTITPLTPTPTVSLTVTATVSRTRTPTATATGTGSHTATATASASASVTPSATGTPTAITIALQMPANAFGEGDECWLNLQVTNDGAARDADLYVLLDVFGSYFSYPSWRPLAEGLDHGTLTVTSGSTTEGLIPSFTMPAVPPAGPFYFYAALFEQGQLGLDYLVSNGAAWDFSFR